MRKAAVARLRGPGRAVRRPRADRGPSARGAWPAAVAGMTAPRAAATGSARLLNLVPYLLARPGIGVAEAAADLGVSERQLREDLELLWVCGLPGYGPGDLIDMAFDGDRVTITYDAGIDRPLRLTPDEALALVVALRMLAQMPGVAGPGRGRAGAGQDRAAAGDAAAGAAGRRAACPADRRPRWPTCRARSQRRRALRMTYYTATRDEITERVVDPMRVLVVGGRAYLEAWCRRAEAVRLFRVDRIDGCTELDEPAAPPPQARRPTCSDGRLPAQPRPAAGHAAGRAGGALDHRVLPVREVVEETARPLAGLAARLRPGLGAPAGARARAGGQRGRRRRSWSTRSGPRRAARSPRTDVGWTRHAVDRVR